MPFIFRYIFFYGFPHFADARPTHSHSHSATHTHTRLIPDSCALLNQADFCVYYQICPIYIRQCRRHPFHSLSCVLQERATARSIGIPLTLTANPNPNRTLTLTLTEP